MRSHMPVLSAFTFCLLLSAVLLQGMCPVMAQGQTAKKKKLNAQLIQAVEDNKIATVKKLLSQGADPNAEDDLGGTPLLYAVNDGHQALAELLLDKGAKLHSIGENGNNPIAAAVYHGNMPMVQMLFKRGATLKEAETGMANCALFGHTSMLKFLLDKGAKVDTLGNPLFNIAGGTPLMNAALGGKPETVRLLIERGANVNAAGTLDKQTPLMFAISAVNPDTGKNVEEKTIVEIVKMLLAKGANVNAKSESDPPKTALSLATEKKLGVVVKLLQESGAKE